MTKKIIQITLQKNILVGMSELNGFLSTNLKNGESVTINNIANPESKIDFICENNTITKSGLGISAATIVDVTINCESEETAELVGLFILRNYGSAHDLIFEEIKSLKRKSIISFEEIKNDNKSNFHSVNSTLDKTTQIILEVMNTLLEQIKTLYTEVLKLREENDTIKSQLEEIKTTANEFVKHIK